MIEEILHCWHALAGGIYWFFAVFWPVFAVYGALYAVGAAAFLLSLRIKSEDGKLVVAYDSLAYKLAHPMLWSRRQRNLADDPEYYNAYRRTEHDRSGSICTFYASLFNMLMFIWPLVLLYWLFCCTVASLVKFLLAGDWMVPDLQGDLWLRDVKLWNKWYPPLAVIGPLAVLVAMAVNFGAVWSVAKFVAMFAVCLLPVAAFLALVIYGTRKVYIAKPGETASVVKEAITANKEKFCKLVEYR